MIAILVKSQRLCSGDIEFEVFFNLPRTLVNVVGTINVADAKDMNLGETCSNIHKSRRYDTKYDFTVVFQPFFRQFRAPKLPNGTIDL